MKHIDAISPRYDKLIARGIARTSASLGHPDAKTLKTKVSELLSHPKKPLSEEELTRVIDALTSPKG
jgi:hypothetical protein